MGRPLPRFQMSRMPQSVMVRPRMVTMAPGIGNRAMPRGISTLAEKSTRNSGSSTTKTDPYSTLSALRETLSAFNSWSQPLHYLVYRETLGLRTDTRQRTGAEPLVLLDHADASWKQA